MTAPGMPRGPWRIVPLVAVVIAIGAAALLLPNSSGDPPSETLPSLPPAGLSDTPVFGFNLPGAVAYLGEDRVFYLVGLSDGAVLGPRRVPADRVPRGASETSAYLGKLPAGSPDTNWDGYQSIPWRETEAIDHTTGNAVTYSRELDTLAIARRPLSDDLNGVEISGPDGDWVAVQSQGLWSFPTWAGIEVLVRELSGDETIWWLVEGLRPAAPRQVVLPDAFQPITATTGYAMGALDGVGVIVEIETGEVYRLPSGFSWAAEWQPGSSRPLLATVREDPPAIVAYNPDGTLEWSAPLRTPVTTFRGGLSWSPDGTYVVVAARSTMEAYNRLGGYLGRFDRSLPTPNPGDDAAFLVVVPRPTE